MAAERVRVLGVIPARLASTRLPRKVLRMVAGEPLLAWVYRAAKVCPGLDDVVVAADSAEVHRICNDNGWPCVLTDPALPSGTDRLFAVSQIRDAEIYVNVQGDEPLLRPQHIDAMLALFSSAQVDVTTLKVRCRTEDVANPNAVKVVTDGSGRALYFSRATIPFDRGMREGLGGRAEYWKHLGLYAYRKRALECFAALAPGQLEQSERLEQLRLLENGVALYVAETEFDTIGVDTEDDLRRVEELLARMNSEGAGAISQSREESRS